MKLSINVANWTYKFDFSERVQKIQHVGHSSTFKCQIFFIVLSDKTRLLHTWNTINAETNISVLHIYEISLSFSTMALASPRVCVIWNYEIPHTVLFGWFLKCQCHYLFSMRVWLVTNGLIFIASYESRTWMVIAYTNYADLQIRFDIYGRG